MQQMSPSKSLGRPRYKYIGKWFLHGLNLVSCQAIHVRYSILTIYCNRYRHMGDTWHLPMLLDMNDKEIVKEASEIDM